jgi:hypothetical protein
MESSFEPGSTVVVVSLVSRSDLSGRRGIVQTFVSASGRYKVKDDGEQATIALKPGNLQPAPAIGSTVILVSLVSRSDLNGRRGIVHGFNKGETTRFEVKVDGEEAILSLKPKTYGRSCLQAAARGGDRPPPRSGRWIKWWSLPMQIAGWHCLPWPATRCGWQGS